MVDIKVRRNRSKVKINYDYPVLVANRSNKFTYLVLLEPKTKKTLTAISSQKVEKGSKSEKAFEVGKLMAAALKKHKYEKVVFDRNGYPFIGRLKQMVEGLKSEGIKL